MSKIDKPNRKSEPGSGEKLQMQLLGAIVDGRPYNGQISQQTLNLLNYAVMTAGTQNDIAARIGVLCGLKIPQGATHCNHATIRVSINGKNFTALYDKSNGWRGMWETEEIFQEGLDSAANRIRRQNNG